MADLSFKRPFGWGILVVSDAGALVPDVDEQDSPALARSDRALVLRVRHAQDQEEPWELDSEGFIRPFVVDVQASVGRAPSEATVEHDLVVESGRVVIGDADGEEELALQPGRYRVCAQLDDPEFAGVVRLWFEPSGD